MKVTRRDALKSAGVLGIATAIGCDDGNGALSDAGLDAALATDASARDAAPPPSRDGGPAPTGPFRHGVASGDPLPDAVILWTRVTIDGASSSMVEWEMSSAATFATIDLSGTAMTDASSDWTVKVDAVGLEPASTYYYRFRMAGTTDVSPIGRTRTAPDAADAVARLRFAVCACSSYAHGWFHAYRNISARADLDAVIHLGDYIYEYGSNQYGSVRTYDPPHEILTLEDYRRRYAHYRSDMDLQDAHRQHPFICVWDDHEVADNAWSGGAGNHDADEGDYGARKAAAQQAYSEWLPIRTVDPSRIYRTLRYGTLAELVMLDTRVEGRTEQAEGTPESRRLLSEAQEMFLVEALSNSEAQWKLIGQQVVFSPVPALFNSDAWDGYPAQRQRVLDAIRTGGEGGAAIDDVVILTGDIHMTFAAEVPVDPLAAPLPPPVAIELVAPGITSPGLAEGPLATSAGRTITRDMPYVKHFDLTHRGYYVLDVAPERVQADFVQIDDVTSPYDPSETASAALVCLSGTSILEPASGHLPPAAGAPPLAP